MTPHQANLLRLLTERGTVAFSREENLRKLAVECLELALVIEHHLEGKRGLEDIAYEGADVTVMLPRAGYVLPTGLRPHLTTIEINLPKVALVATALAVEILSGRELQFVRLYDMADSLNWLRGYLGSLLWEQAMNVKLSKAERYITDRELGRQPQSLLSRPAGGLE